jgi:hypothetical protein
MSIGLEERLQRCNRNLTPKQRRGKARDRMVCLRTQAATALVVASHKS